MTNSYYFISRWRVKATPEEVFAELHRRQHGGRAPSEALARAFGEILATVRAEEVGR